MCPLNPVPLASASIFPSQLAAPVMHLDFVGRARLGALNRVDEIAIAFERSGLHFQIELGLRRAIVPGQIAA